MSRDLSYCFRLFLAPVRSTGHRLLLVLYPIEVYLCGALIKPTARLFTSGPEPFPSSTTMANNTEPTEVAKSIIVNPSSLQPTGSKGHSVNTLDNGLADEDLSTVQQHEPIVTRRELWSYYCRFHSYSEDMARSFD